MNVAPRRPMSREEFLDWDGHLAMAMPEIGIELAVAASYDGIVAPGVEEDEGR